MSATPPSFTIEEREDGFHVLARTSNGNYVPVYIHKSSDDPCPFCHCKTDDEDRCICPEPVVLIYPTMEEAYKSAYGLNDFWSDPNVQQIA